jgi:hypothetical protein
MLVKEGLLPEKLPVKADDIWQQTFHSLYVSMGTFLCGLLMLFI